MTTSVSTRTPGTLNPTRQQLDELDALLQRMLELPVNKLEEAEPAAEAVEAPPPAPAKETRPALEPPAMVLQSPPPTPVQPKETRPATAPMAYTVVETASPRPLPPASGFEPRPSVLPRLAPATAPQQQPLEKEPEALPAGHAGRPGAANQQEPREKEPEAPASLPASPAAETPPETPLSEDETWVPLRSTWQPSAQTWQPLADSWHQANGAPAPNAVPSPIPSPLLDAAPPSEIMTSAELSPPAAPPAVESIQRDAPLNAADEPNWSLSTEDAPTEDAPIDGPRLLLPLLWFNQGFDACLSPLGAPGRWLCGRRGRQLLGIVGLTCLAAAAAIAVSAGMGWTW